MHQNPQDSLPESLTVPRTDAVYLCHAYLTKVPLGAIEPFILAFSEPGETVVDPFAGSGMTGLAAERLGRRARVSDISVLGRHIGQGYATRVSPTELLEQMRAVVATARSSVGSLYQTTRLSDGRDVELVRTVWSFTYECPTCTTPLVYFSHLSPSGAPPKACPNCQTPFVRRTWPRALDVPVEVVVRGSNGKQVEQPVTSVDEGRIAIAEADPRLSQVPSLEIGVDREMYSRSGLGKVGLNETKAFFSARNAIVLYELRTAIEAVVDSAIRQKLLFAFTASLARASRRYQWGPKRPLNAQNQTYYIAPVYYEWNVFELFERKVEATIKASRLLAGSRPLLEESGAFEYRKASATHLDYLEDQSVDYVFTDPPFGSNLFYSDMSLFHEAWLSETTDPTNEAVVFTTGSRKKTSAARYEMLLADAFREAYRVLKPGRAMSVVFGNSSGEVWGFVQRALRDAGFSDPPIHVAVLDKGQRSVKGLNSGSEKVATVDLVMTVRKPEGGLRSTVSAGLIPSDVPGLIAQALAGLTAIDARNPSHVYARVLKEAIRQHRALDDLHLADVLSALSQAGYVLEPKSGLLVAPKRAA
jgi:16S rRNA G966 N2-methylase RsmD